jgi:nucleoid-associated protein YgaU
MSRYNKSLVIRDKQQKRRLDTTLMPFIALDAADIYIVTLSVERLDLLADRFYGDSTLWWVIASANNLGKGTYVVPTNTRLRIPTNIQQIQDQIELFNGTR